MNIKLSIVFILLITKYLLYYYKFSTNWIIILSVINIFVLFDIIKNREFYDQNVDTFVSTVPTTKPPIPTTIASSVPTTSASTVNFKELSDIFKIQKDEINALKADYDNLIDRYKNNMKNTTERDIRNTEIIKNIKVKIIES